MQEVDQIHEVVSGLHDTYPREAHRGRLEQIDQVTATLTGLIGELPAEEAREADYADRLVASYRSGNWKSAHPDHGHTHSDTAAQRLQEALAAGEGN